jgi:hypothetical protein
MDSFDLPSRMIMARKFPGMDDHPSRAGLILINIDLTHLSAG